MATQLIDKAHFADQRNWNGTYYELAIEYYPSGHDKRILNAINAVWNESALTGTWGAPGLFDTIPRMPETPEGLGEVENLFGYLELPGGRAVGCMTRITREENGSDWVSLSIPLAMIGHVFSGRQPL